MVVCIASIQVLIIELLAAGQMDPSEREGLHEERVLNACCRGECCEEEHRNEEENTFQCARVTEAGCSEWLSLVS